jgi:hypothetical protein
LIPGNRFDDDANPAAVLWSPIRRVDWPGIESDFARTVVVGGKNIRARDVMVRDVVPLMVARAVWVLNIRATREARAAIVWAPVF